MRPKGPRQGKLMKRFFETESKTRLAAGGEGQKLRLISSKIGLADAMAKILSKIKYLYIKQRVVQLFNAVRKQQKILKEQLDDAGPTEAKIKNFRQNDKRKILGFTKRTTRVNVSNQRMNMKTEIKQHPQVTQARICVLNVEGEKFAPENESDEEGSNKKKWDILREDYMMGAKMKDWDKESDSENPQSDNEMDSGSDSG
ncbi:unnamed protein product [Mytilus edulis]|uniref:RRP15-like protein n=1 Tax=Mytilus edulis TaxID=6550 RepID=A0A8S3TZL6_MYTED|nr:unnamed protein product [Mytilus edulis]